MIKRYNKEKMKKTIIKRVIISIPFLLVGVTILILTENISYFEHTIYEIIGVMFVISFMSVLVSIAPIIRKWDIESNCEKYDNYIKKHKNNLSLLFDFYINNKLGDVLLIYKQIINEYYANTFDLSFEFIHICGNKKYIIKFYEKSIEGCICNKEEFEFNTNEKDWHKLEYTKFRDISTIIEYVVEKLQFLVELNSRGMLEKLNEFKNIMPNDIREAHKYSSRHKDKLKLDKKCGCFYCLKIFEPIEITEWLNEGCGTALCPYCQIDSVIGESSGYPITYEFLKKMHKYWFND